MNKSAEPNSYTTPELDEQPVRANFTAWILPPSDGGTEGSPTMTDPTLITSIDAELQETLAELERTLSSTEEIIAELEATLPTDEQLRADLDRLIDSCPTEGIST